MKEQTALDWFFDKIKSHFEHDGDLFEALCFTYRIAKDKEENQLNDSASQWTDMKTNPRRDLNDKKNPVHNP